MILPWALLGIAQPNTGLDSVTFHELLWIWNICVLFGSDELKYYNWNLILDRNDNDHPNHFLNPMSIQKELFWLISWLI